MCPCVVSGVPRICGCRTFLHPPLDWTDALSLDDIPQELREVAETVAGAPDALAVARLLVREWGGGSVYVPALRDLRRRSLARRARTLFDPSAREGQGNTAEVCRALGVSRRHLASLLRD